MRREIIGIELFQKERYSCWEKVKRKWIQRIISESSVIKRTLLFYLEPWICFESHVNTCHFNTGYCFFLIFKTGKYSQSLLNPTSRAYNKEARYFAIWWFKCPLDLLPATQYKRNAHYHLEQDLAGSTYGGRSVFCCRGVQGPNCTQPRIAVLTPSFLLSESLIQTRISLSTQKLNVCPT